MTSVIMGRPVISEAFFRYLNPSSSRPWKLSGLVLGLNAPPLKICAPEAFILFAMAIICSLLSTAQGPAMITVSFPIYTFFTVIVFFILVYGIIQNLMQTSATFKKTMGAPGFEPGSIGLEPTIIARLYYVPLLRQ